MALNENEKKILRLAIEADPAKFTADFLEKVSQDDDFARVLIEFYKSRKLSELEVDEKNIAQQKSDLESVRALLSS